MGWWRNGSAFDSRSKGCVFKSRPAQDINDDHLCFLALALCIFIHTYISQTSILGKDAKNGQQAKASINMRRAIVKSCSRKNPEQSVKKC